MLLPAASWADPKKVEAVRKFYKNHGLDFFGDLISDQVDAASDEKRHAKLELLADDARTKALKQLDSLLRGSRGSSMEAELLIRKATLLADRARTASFFQNSSVKSTKLKAPRVYLEESTNVFLEVERKFPKHPRMDVVLFSIGYNYGEMGTSKVDSAFTYYEKTVKKFPESPLVGDARLAMAEILFDKRKFQASVNQLKEIVKSNHPRLKNFALYKMAWSYYNLADLDSAMLSLEKAIDGVNHAEGAQRARIELRKEALNDLSFFYSEKPGLASDVATAAINYFDRVAKTPDSIAEELTAARAKRVQSLKEKKAAIPDEDRDEMQLLEANEQLLRLTNIYREQGKHEHAYIVAGKLIERMSRHPKVVFLYRLRAEAAEKLRKRELVHQELRDFAQLVRRDLPPVKGYEDTLPTLKAESAIDFFSKYSFRETRPDIFTVVWPELPKIKGPDGNREPDPSEEGSLYARNLTTASVPTIRDFAQFFHGEFNKTGNLESAKHASAVYDVAFATFAAPWRAIELPQLFELVFAKAALHFAQKQWALASQDFEWLALRLGNKGHKKDKDFEAAIKSLIASGEGALKEQPKDKTLQEKVLKTYDLYLAAYLNESITKGTEKTTVSSILAASARLNRDMKNQEQALHRALFYTLFFSEEKDAVALAKDATSQLEKAARWEDLRDYANLLLERKGFAGSELAKDLRKSREYANLKLLEQLEENKDWSKASREFEKFAEQNPDSSFVSQALIKAARATIETGDHGEALARLEKATKAPDVAVRTQAWLALEPYYRKAFLWFELGNSYEELLKLKLDSKTRSATEQNLKTIRDLNHTKFIQGGAKVVNSDADVEKTWAEFQRFEKSLGDFFKLRFVKSNNNPQSNFKKKADQHKILNATLEKTVDRTPKSLRGAARLWATIVKTELLGEFAETLETAALPAVLNQATEADRKAYVETIMGNAKELRDQATSLATEILQIALETDCPFNFDQRIYKILEKYSVPFDAEKGSFEKRWTTYWKKRPSLSLESSRDPKKVRTEIRKLGEKLLNESDKEGLRKKAIEIAEKYLELSEYGLAYATAAILKDENKSDDAGIRAARLQHELDFARLPLTQIAPGTLTATQRWDLARYLAAIAKSCSNLGLNEGDCEWFSQAPKVLLRWN